MTGIALGVAFLAGAWQGALGATLVLAAAVFVWLLGWCRVPLVALVLMLSVFGAYRAADSELPGVPIDINVTEEFVGRVDSFPAATSRGHRFELQVQPRSGSTGYKLCVISGSHERVEEGALVRVTGNATPAFDLSDRLQAMLRARGCAASGVSDEEVTLQEPSQFQQLINAVRRRIANVFQRAAPGDTGALMTGLVIGDDSALSEDAREAFLDTGTTHITAVSGSNFALVVLIVSMVAGSGGMRRRLPWIAVVTTAIWFYAILVEVPPSALRAALMATGALLAVRFGRRPDFVTLLVVCAALQVAIRPSDLHSLSFQLSLAATLPLVLVLPRLQLSLYQWPVALLATAIAAHLATIPVLAHRLGEIAPATVPTNILISPFVTIGFVLAAAAALVGVVSESAGIAVAIPASAAAAAILEIVQAASAWLPGRLPVGARSGATIVGLVAVCWGAIFSMSADVRIAASRGIARLHLSNSSARGACLAAPLIAAGTIIAGVLLR